MDEVSTSQHEEPSQVRDKAIRLFTYLKALCALRTTQVRNVASYDHVFWLADLPRDKLCRCIVWRITDPQPENADQSLDVWLEIRKPTLKSSPELPDELEPWIKEDEINNSSLEEPSFYEQIPLSALQGEATGSDPNALASLSDYPHVFDAYVDYVETKWKPWAAEDHRLQKVQKAYNQLFNIYQRQEKLGEQYEVVIGLGLLMWRSPNSGEIRRHILTLQARIEFDRVRGIMLVRPPLDGPQPMLECDMLETSDRPNPTVLTEIMEDVSALDGDPWEAEGLEQILRGFINAVPNPGDYHTTLEHTSGLTTKPVVNLSPALILRRRTQRTFVDFYRQIIEQVEDGDDIPENIRRIVEIVEDSDDSTEDCDGNEVLPGVHVESDTELYFPLPANDEQKRIVQRIERRRGVLVQGPPGTGKSHTIANLIAHFLAKGKRILVTSETPRALEVLRYKLHKDMSEIEELCVVWLGAGPESHNALEKSVLGITQRKVTWNASEEVKRINQLVKNIDSERREQARLRHELRACRETDFYVHSNVFGRYSGTLQQIAIQLNAARQQFEWFTDRPREAIEPGIKVDDLLEMLRIHRQLSTELINQLGMRIFPVKDLITPNDFCHLVDTEKRATTAHMEAQERRAYPGYIQLSALSRENRQKVKRLVEEILASLEYLAKHYYAWAERAAREIAGDQDRVWRHILLVTKDHIGQVGRIITELGDIKVTGLEGKILRIVAEDAVALKSHLDAGKRLGFWMFRPQVVKRCLYLINEVRVDGKPCDNNESLRRLLSWIDITTRFESLSDLWKSITNLPQGSPAIQCAAYHDLCEPISDALVVYDRIQQIKETCHDCAGIRFPAWHSREDVGAFFKALDALDVEEDLKIARRVFQPMTEAVTQHLQFGDAHPLTKDLLQAIVQRDCDNYKTIYGQISTLHTWANAYRFACDIHNRFKACAPRTCETYDGSNSDSVWDTRLSDFDRAWTWAKTERWLNDAGDREKFRSIMQALDNSASRERDLLKNLAAAKAWQNCMQKLGEKERMALIAWKKAVEKIRGGHGKYVEQYREAARQKLEECRTAIPAWVMPLYQVVQTTKPRAHLFDIVIIDEASQSGPEALLLNYIAEKIIVVGDDKQITPLHVGVDREQVQYLRRMHLRDIPHADMLDLESSLFSQAELRFPDRIRLREHFRCMPEIIQFSNNLSYPTEPLIPLRQYGANRLPPIKTVLVKDGYRRGSNDNIENRPEAEAIVAQIAECCENPEYHGKTFGVICLMGSHQSEIINNLLVQEIGAEEMERRRLVCGRPYDFQGDERDIVFLSMVDATEEGQICRMVRDPDTQRRFNVAVSRARDQLWLFHSATLNDLRSDCLKYRLLEYCLNPKVDQPDEIGDTTINELRRMALNRSMRQSPSPKPFDSWFEVDVFLKILDKGYRVLPQYKVNAKHIDLVVEGLRGRLAVECDGDEYHGIEQYEADMTRQRDLQRCGWTFWRVRGSDFYRNPDEALDTLWEALEHLGIFPRHLWNTEPKHREDEMSSATDVLVSTAYDVTASDELEEDEEPIKGEKESISQSNTLETGGGRLDHALEFARSRKRHPEELPPWDIQSAIIHALESCSNKSCTLKSITSRTLRQLGVITRGNPRVEFEKRVIRNLAVLKRKGIVVEYKAKNKRIRLNDHYQPSLL